MSISLQGKRIFVTGATGFIGGYAARRLHAEGAHVVALARNPGKVNALKEAGIEIAMGDLIDHARMAEIVAADIDTVMHIGAWLPANDTGTAEAVNVTSTRMLARASAEAGVRRFIFTSSIAAYGPHGDRDVDESTPLTPYGEAYGDSKIRAEEALKDVAQETGLDAVIVRPGMVYGPGSQGWTVRMAGMAKRGLIPLINGGTGSAFPIYIDNLVDMLLLCATHPDASGEIFNGVDDPATVAEFLGGYMAMIPTNRAWRWPGWLTHAVLWAANPFVSRFDLAYVANQLTGRGIVSNQKARDVLGWEPQISLEEGLRRSEAWLRAEKLI